MTVNELLFWKVIHNKYLFRMIFQIIHSTNWVYYTNHKQISHDNRIKFEYANKFEWFLKHKQIELLKYKINTNQFILINKYSIISFFKLYSNEQLLTTTITTTTMSSSSPYPNYKKYTLEELDEILKFLLDKKRDEFEICDLTNLLVTSCNSGLRPNYQFNSGIIIHLIKILICKPYSIKLYPSSIKYIIENEEPEFLNEIFKLSIDNENIIFGDEIRKDAFKLSINNKRMKTLLIKSKLLSSSQPILVKEFEIPLPPQPTIRIRYIVKEEKEIKVKKSKDNTNNKIYNDKKRNGNLESLKRYLNKKYIGSGQSIKLFHMGIRYCNIHLLNDIDSLNSKFKECNDLNIKLKSDTTISNLSNMVSYFVNNKFKSFSSCLLEQFGNHVISFLSIHNIPIIHLPNYQDFNQLFNMVQDLIFIFAKNSYQNFKYMICNSSILSNDLKINEEFTKEDFIHNLFDHYQNIYYNYIIGFNYDQIVEIVLVLVNKYKCNGSSELETINITGFINYFWDSIIASENIQINQLIQIYNTIKEHSIIINHSLFHSFHYLLIRNPKFTRYIFSRPSICSPFISYYKVELNIRYLDNDNYDFGNYLNVDLFTFDYIFSKDQNGDFINSFDTIIHQLIQQLSYSALSDMSQVNVDFTTTSLNYNLQFLIVIGRNDLFFKELDYISNKVKENIQIDESFPALISTFDSPYFNSLTNCSYENSNNIDDEPNFIKTFEIQSNTIKIACIKMDLESIKRIITINYNYQLFHESIFEAAVESQRLYIISFILDNFKINFTFNYWLSSIESNDYKVMEFLFSKYNNILVQPYQLKLLESLDNILSNNENQELFNEFLNNSNSRINILKSLLPNIINEFENDYSDEQYIQNEIYQVKRKKLKLNLVYNQDLEFQLFISNLKIDLFQDYNFFNISFKEGNIELCNLILKYYPNQLPSCNSISSVIKENKIHIIKYYQQQQHSIFNQLQFDLIKSDMLNHLDYKYIK